MTVNEFVRDLTLGKELKVYGRQFWRPYCHVSDIVRAIHCILESPQEKVGGEIFGVGDTEENYTKQMIVEEIGKIFPAVGIEYVQKESVKKKIDLRKCQLDDWIGRHLPGKMKPYMQGYWFFKTVLGELGKDKLEDIASIPPNGIHQIKKPKLYIQFFHEQLEQDERCKSG